MLLGGERGEQQEPPKYPDAEYDQRQGVAETRSATTGIFDGRWQQALLAHMGDPDCMTGEHGIPGPPERLGPLQALMMSRDPLGFFEACRLRFGEVFELPFGTALRRNVWVCNPLLAQQVIEASADELEAAKTNAIVEPIVGDRSLLLLAGEEHAKRRTLMWPAFDPARLRRDSVAIHEETVAQLGDWEPGTEVPLWRWAQKLTAAIMVRVVFGINRGAQFDALTTGVHEIVELAHNPAMLMPWLQVDLGPLSPWGRFERQKAAVQELLYEQIRRRRGDRRRGRHTDILSLAIGRRLPDQDVSDEILTLLIAGNQTTAAGLTWTLELLLRNLDKLAVLRAELEQDDNTDYLDAVVKEALRLRVPLFALGRGTQREYRLGRFTIPAGVGIAVPLLLVYRAPELFKDATSFRPERFLQDDPGPPEWMPFGGGIRSCIGRDFARLQIGAIVRAVVKEFDLRLVNRRPARPRLMSGALVVPDTDVPVRVTVRRPGQNV